jgi:hypothetical protein
MKNLWNLPSSINWLIFTLIFTIILLTIFDISIITIVGFLSGIILATGNLYKEEFNKEKQQ